MFYLIPLDSLLIILVFLMKKKRGKVIFLGGVGSPSEFGGELTKNKEIIARMRNLGFDIKLLDTFGSRRNKIRLVSIFFQLLLFSFLYPKALFIFSTSFGNIYSLLRVLSYLPVRLRLIYWGIGGYFPKRFLSGEFNLKYVKLIRLFIVEGRLMKEQLREAGFTNILCLPNFKTLGQLPKIDKFQDGLVHFLFLSRIREDKGCTDIFEAVNLMNKKGLKDKFVVDFYGVVDSEYKSEFDNYLMRLENVRYCGILNLFDDTNYSILARYHFMLFPTYWIGEGFPGVLIDAYKSGVPIIASDWNLNSEFIKDSVTGFLFPTHSVESLATIMGKAILGNFDNYMMSNSCQQMVIKYDTPEVLTLELFDLFYKLIDNNKII